MPRDEFPDRGTDLRRADVVAPRERGVPGQPPAGLVVHQGRGYPVGEHPRGPGQTSRVPAGGPRPAARWPRCQVSREPAVTGKGRPGVRKDRLVAGPRRGGHSALRREIEVITRPTMMITSTNTSRISAAS
jgi:hypothetical protein